MNQQRKYLFTYEGFVVHQFQANIGIELYSQLFTLPDHDLLEITTNLILDEVFWSFASPIKNQLQVTAHIPAEFILILLQNGWYIQPAGTLEIPLVDDFYPSN